MDARLDRVRGISAWVPGQNWDGNEKTGHDHVVSCFLVRLKGFEPPTFWFVVQK